jgi:hypothetical protein
MSEKSRGNNLNIQFERERNVFQKWVPVFQHLGLKPRRFVQEMDASYVCTAEGWFRLSLLKYRKAELNWLRSILDYLEEQSFNNWAVTWRKTIIWEEGDACYLIQPWVVSPELFQPGDPAALGRLAEILAELYRCGKDYRGNRGREIIRDHWSAMPARWRSELEKVQSIKEEHFHEKIRKEVDGLRKKAETLLEECIRNWELGIQALFEHHLQLGVLGHGQLLAKYIVWRGHDYYLLNWEHLAFQPKIMDLASLINDLAYWEPEWIIYFINQYTKLQPLWPEEYHGLQALLQYPGELLSLLAMEPLKELDHKVLKEVDKGMKRKGRCLDKVWRELGSNRTNWAWRKEFELPKDRLSGKISLALAPVETWGGLPNDPADALIHVNSEEKLPSDIWRRLVNLEQDRVLGGSEGGIMEAASDVGDDPLFGKIGLNSPEDGEELVRADGLSLAPVSETLPTEPVGPEQEPTSGQRPVAKQADSARPSQTGEGPSGSTVLCWSDFPKPLKRGNGR